MSALQLSDCNSFYENLLIFTWCVYILQFIGWNHSYNAALNAALRMPQYRSRAKEIARERGLLDRKRKGVMKVSFTSPLIISSFQLLALTGSVGSTTYRLSRGA